MRILLIEDDAIIALAAEAALRAAGHDVIGPICDSDQAVALAVQQRPHLALVDINLAGGEEGVAIARRLNALGVRSVFARGQPDIARAHKDAAMGVLEKPYSDLALQNTIPVLESVLQGGTPPPPALPTGLELFG
jgi:two-component system, response regulator PdtaR